MFFRARRNGTIDLQLDFVVRDVIGRVCAELRDSLNADLDDPALRRLFPPAYLDDPDRERAYEQLVQDDLLTSRIRALDTVLATVEGDKITAAEAEQWLHALNAVRLTLGTQLDVSEDRDPNDIDEDDPLLPQILVYDLLSVVLSSLLSVVPR